MSYDEAHGGLNLPPIQANPYSPTARFAAMHDALFVFQGFVVREMSAYEYFQKIATETVRQLGPPSVRVDIASAQTSLFKSIQYQPIPHSPNPEDASANQFILLHEIHHLDDGIDGEPISVKPMLYVVPEDVFDGQAGYDIFEIEEDMEVSFCRDALIGILGKDENGGFKELLDGLFTADGAYIDTDEMIREQSEFVGWLRQAAQDLGMSRQFSQDSHPEFLPLSEN